MTEQQIKEVFESYGLSKMYTRFQTPLYVTGLFDEVEEDQLEDFFDHFELSPDVFFDEFRFWFQYYTVAQRHM
ncbi:hypothetical protein LCL89_04860 [Halobacillus yeomjeoni]|uniref:Uncharacterized protein n=1 Tax=Halobacillus yeomjeoni TaxID=311194 RepID=A0A931HTM2_9BACI|nr:hypothetical protein [Halobacillus yeomjeoni]MBH0229221.1 hypothetical protein [Halobacillus yeomjeoni]MCA0983380.1 hypothetical protein [Halobacillus yeomjeoni]